MDLPRGRAGDQRSLLSPSHYDDDAASLRSVSDQESDSEDDQVLKGARNSREIAEHDKSVLKEEEEREKLLLVGQTDGNGLRRVFTRSDISGSKVRIGRQERGRQRGQDRKATRRKKKGKGHEESELMYEMEEGGLRDDTSSACSSAESSDLDREKFNSVLRDQVTSPCRRFASVESQSLHYYRSPNSGDPQCRLATPVTQDHGLCALIETIANS